MKTNTQRSQGFADFKHQTEMRNREYGRGQDTIMLCKCLARFFWV